MIKITDYNNSNRNHRYIHLIHGSTPYGDYLQLKEQYRQQDLDYSHWTVRAKFSIDVLLGIKKINNGNIICVYCGKENLRISPINETKKHLPTLATADHFWPISKGGDKFNSKNIVPSCYKCNNKKADKILSLDMLKYLYRYPNEKDILEGLMQLGVKLGYIKNQ